MPWQVRSVTYVDENANLVTLTHPSAALDEFFGSYGTAGIVVTVELEARRQVRGKEVVAGYLLQMYSLQTALAAMQIKLVLRPTCVIFLLADVVHRLSSFPARGC